MLAVSDAIDFNLGKLNLSGGTHKLVIRARAEDYEVSDYSNEVSYSVHGGETLEWDALSCSIDEPVDCVVRFNKI